MVEIEVRCVSGELLMHLRLLAAGTIADLRQALAEGSVWGAQAAVLISENRVLEDEQVLSSLDDASKPLVVQIVRQAALPPLRSCTHHDQEQHQNEDIDDDDEPQAFVVDIGSGTVKLGFAGDDQPRSIFPTVVGRVKEQVDGSFPAIDIGLLGLSPAVGNEANSKHSVLVLSHPIQNGIVTNWDDAEKIWHHTFYNELRGVAPENHPLLITEPPLSPKKHREQLTQLMFETFNAAGLYLATSSVLALYASGRTTGVVVDSGEDHSRVVPVCEGYLLPHALRTFYVGGGILTDHLMCMVKERGFIDGCNASNDRDSVQQFKEQFCYVALQFEDEMSSWSIAEDVELRRPNGDLLGVLGNERIRCLEAVFQPSLVNVESGGLHDLVAESIGKCNAELLPKMYANIVLAGGSTCVRGFEHRLVLELRRLVPDNMHVQVDAPSNRAYSAWIGGSLLADSPSFKKYWITKDRYDELGPDIVHRMCL